MEEILSLILIIVLIYLFLGVFFTLIFLWKGLNKVDPATVESGFIFKLLIVPGLLIFWPLFSYSWFKDK